MVQFISALIDGSGEYFDLGQKLIVRVPFAIGRASLDAKGAFEVSEGCKGCGACAAVCPQGYIARAKQGAALVCGTDATAKEAAEATRRKLDECDAVLVGAGAGLSAAAGFSYSGKRFDENFADFRDRFGITNMYSDGFHPFPDLETYWAWWSRAILLNRYEAGVGKPYLDLLCILEGRGYFVLTTNVDHQFQLAGFGKARLF